MKQGHATTIMILILLLAGCSMQKGRDSSLDQTGGHSVRFEDAPPVPGLAYSRELKCNFLLFKRDDDLLLAGAAHCLRRPYALRSLTIEFVPPGTQAARPVSVELRLRFAALKTGLIAGDGNYRNDLAVFHVEGHGAAATPQPLTESWRRFFAETESIVVEPNRFDELAVAGQSRFRFIYYGEDGKRWGQRSATPAETVTFIHEDSLDVLHQFRVEPSASGGGLYACDSDGQERYIDCHLVCLHGGAASDGMNVCNDLSGGQ